MTLKKKIAYCTGADFWHTKALPDAAPLMLADGPHGLRVQAGKGDMLGSQALGSPGGSHRPRSRRAGCRGGPWSGLQRETQSPWGTEL